MFVDAKGIVPRVTDPLRPGDPTELGGYRLLGRLGRGGMGSVYLGRDQGGRLVAVKVIRPEYASEAEFRGRFRSEVNRARQVPPFCTAEVLDADPDHPTPYLVVEYVDGPSLAQVVAEQGPLAAGNLHSVAVGVATALAAIHGAGVIHRDLKPANVLFALGTPKVIDFGIARAFEVTSQHTRTDQMVGTVAYMAPERFDTDHHTPVGPAADVFAWGAVVTYAGTSRTPFQADSPAATAARILTQPPELSALPQTLQSVVARTLAKDPRERPSAHELLDLLLDVDPADATQPVRPELIRAAKAAQRTKPRSRAKRVVVAALVTLALGVGGLFAAHSAPRVLASLSADGDAAVTTPTVSESPSPAPSRRRLVQGPTIIDHLDRPGQWTPTKSEAGDCVFAGDQLRVTTRDANEYRCQGPEETFAGDQSVTVDVTVRTRGACAGIWFRSVPAGAYQLTVCEKEVRLGVTAGDDYSDEKKAALPATKLGQARRVEIAVRDDQATVHVDGIAALSTELGEPSLAAGQVEFGAINDIQDGDVSAAFADAVVESL